MKYRFVHTLQIGDGPSLCMVALAPLADTENATMRRYERWARAWGYGRVAAVNVHPVIVDSRCTGLDAWGAAPDTAAAEDNLNAVMDAAHGALTVVACWGAGQRTMSPARDALMSASVPLFSLGTNADGSPKHPSGRALPAIPILSLFRCPSCAGTRQKFSDPGPQFATRWIDCPTCYNPLRPRPGTSI